MALREVRRLVDYPYVVVKVRCWRCPYLKGYRVARLAARLGPDIDLHAMLDLLECGRGRPKKLRKLQDFCGVIYADLMQEPAPDQAGHAVRERLFYDDGT